MKMGLGIIPIKEMTELVQFRWFGHVLRCPRMACQVRTQGKGLTRRPPADLGRRNTKDFEGKRN